MSVTGNTGTKTTPAVFPTTYVIRVYVQTLMSTNVHTSSVVRCHINTPAIVSNHPIIHIIRVTGLYVFLGGLSSLYYSFAKG